MRRRIAVTVCAALVAAMLGACGGSTGASGGQAEAAAETEAEQTQEETAEAEAPAEETQAAEAETPAEETQAADTQAAADDVAQDLSAGTNSFGNGTILGGAITPSEAEENADYEKIDAADPQAALGSAPEIEGLEPIEGAEGNPLAGMVSVGGEVQEYSAFYMGENQGIMGFVVTFGNISDILTNYAEVYDFDKSAGYTREDMLRVDVDSIYPGFTSMSCTDYRIVDAGGVYRLMLLVMDLDDPDNVKEAMDNGIFTSSTYYYPQVLSASGLNSSLRSSGMYEMTDEEIQMMHLIE